MSNVLLLLILFVAAPDIRSALPTVESDHVCSFAGHLKPLHLTKGDYLSTEYLRRLSDTLSPSDAYTEGSNPLARVGCDGVVDIGTWHDGAISLRLTENDGVLLHHPPATCSMNIPDDKHFRLDLSSEPLPLEFAYVGNLDRYIERLLFVGDYRDEQGTRWRFFEKGQYEHQDRAGAYALYGDESGFYDDSVWLDGVQYRFARTKQNLTLYKPVERNSPGADAPVHSLTLSSHGVP